MCPFLIAKYSVYDEKCRLHRGRDVEVALMTHFRHHTTTSSPITAQMNHSSVMNTRQRQTYTEEEKQMKGRRRTTLPCVLDNHDLSEPIQRFVRNATVDKQKTVREFKKKKEKGRTKKETGRLSIPEYLPGK